MMTTTMAGTGTAASVRWNPLLRVPPNTSILQRQRQQQQQRQRVRVVCATKRDMDRVLREAWQTANDGFERFVFEARKTAERIDRRYSVSHRLSSVARAAADRAREIDRDLEIGLRYRAFTSDFARNWPKVTPSSLL